MERDGVVLEVRVNEITKRCAARQRAYYSHEKPAINGDKFPLSDLLKLKQSNDISDSKPNTSAEAAREGLGVAASYCSINLTISE